MDELIMQREGLSIPEIVDRYGWERFRETEAEIAGELAGLENSVIASGGGVVTREKNIQELKRNGILVWLKASPDYLLQRIGQDSIPPPGLDKIPPAVLGGFLNSLRAELQS